MKCTADWHKKEFVENVENDGNPESNCQKKSSKNCRFLLQLKSGLEIEK